VELRVALSYAIISQGSLAREMKVTHKLTVTKPRKPVAPSIEALKSQHTHIRKTRREKVVSQSILFP
jgi:hypothetical protein